MRTEVFYLFHQACLPPNKVWARMMPVFFISNIGSNHVYFLSSGMSFVPKGQWDETNAAANGFTNQVFFNLSWRVLLTWGLFPPVSFSGGGHMIIGSNHFVGVVNWFFTASIVDGNKCTSTCLFGPITVIFDVKKGQQGMLVCFHSTYRQGPSWIGAPWMPFCMLHPNESRFLLPSNFSWQRKAPLK